MSLLVTILSILLTSPAQRQAPAKQAVVETSAGTFVIDLRPELAPSHVAYFMKLASEETYNRTTFHRAIRLGIIQGGDPLSKNPSKQSLYGTGGLGVLKSEHSADRSRSTCASENHQT